MRKNHFLISILHLIFLTLIIILAFYYSINHKKLVGPIMILIALVSLLPAIFFKIHFDLLKSDIIFGLLDNGLLVVFAIVGAELFGTFGAVVGGAVGNAITDGFAGIFEGNEAQKIKYRKRTALSVAIGKVSGCLFGAGIILTIAWTILGL